MANTSDFPETKPEKLTRVERNALLLTVGGAAAALTLVLFLSRYLYLLT